MGIVLSRIAKPKKGEEKKKGPIWRDNQDELLIATAVAAVELLNGIYDDDPPPPLY